MAYDEKLAERVRRVLPGDVSVSERKMFGGLAFLIGGNMAVGASGQGGILVRVDPEESAELVATTNASSTSGRYPSNVVSDAGPRPVASASSDDAASPLTLASG